ncbi:hypothetical protein MJO28_007452 [Puccinia striiformis f. sp. tritici]|uniref:Uncharacterized protein n=2 Tax=Puccinia striiformis TaxID=27350 RepID=A0A2S4VPS4_9BASI|nr:hypothetical protein MJO28_007452 [Puccinia striiformis f. sp. tritici]POW11448.1 hypothetical protein PSTT_05219 [Puccinia striiformis]
MDTDWCIVCDTKILPQHSLTCDNYDDEEANDGQTTQNSGPVPFSAFCSQDCLIKSYIEAASQVHAHEQPKNNGGRLGRTKNNDSLMLYPRFPKDKSKMGGTGPLHQLQSNSKYISVRPARKRVVSKFTLSSCGSSSSTSSSSSST